MRLSKPSRVNLLRYSHQLKKRKRLSQSLELRQRAKARLRPSNCWDFALLCMRASELSGAFVRYGVGLLYGHGYIYHRIDINTDNSYME